MAKYRERLPQLEGELFLTDGGIETCLIFQQGLALPLFAAFDLLKDAAGTEALRRYYGPYAELARDAAVGFVLESPTWRASADWGARLGYSDQALADANRRALDLMHELRARYETARSPLVISGCLGPRGDGYDPGALMTPEQAQTYHTAQAELFAAAGADLVTAITMTNVPEAIGIARAARGAGMPVAISFTLETDGRLPTGQLLGEAIEAVDAATGGAPAYFMINCAHPSHFAHVLEESAAWQRRLRGLRANASRRSHAELDAAPDLDAGDPVALGAEYAALCRRHPQLCVLGGCCGTDERHVRQILAACAR